VAKAAQSTEGEIELPGGGDAVDTLPVPTSPGQLSADWLTFALNEGGFAGAVVSDIEVSPLDATSGNSGSYAIVKLAYSNRAEGAPESLFAKMTAESFRGFLGNSHVREIAAYKEYLPILGISVPRLYYGVAQPEGGPAILLLEDMSAHRLGDFNVGATEAEIAATVATLVKIHSPYWGNEQLIHDDRLLIDTYAGEHSTYQNSEFLAGLAAGIPEDERLSDYIARTLALIGEGFEALGARIMASPRTLAHTDFRIDNLLYSGPPAEPEVTVFDWGVVGSLRGTYDLASFLTSAYMPTCKNAAQDPIDMYYRELLEAGVTGYLCEDLKVDYATAALLMLHRRVTGIHWAKIKQAPDQVLAMRRTGLHRCARHIELLRLADILD